MCIKPATLSFPLALYVCPNLPFFPPLHPLLPLCLLPLFLPFAFVFGSSFLSFLPSLSRLSILSTPCLCVLAHFGSPRTKPATLGPASASSSPYLREQKTAVREDRAKNGWDLLSQPYVLPCCFLLFYTMSLVLPLKLTKGQTAAAVAALLII